MSIPEYSCYVYAEVDTFVTYDPKTFKETWKVVDKSNDMSFQAIMIESGIIECTFESGQSGKVDFHIYDSMGRLLKKDKVDHSPDQSVKNIHINGEFSGMLIATCTQNGKMLSSRIILSR